MSIDKHLSAKDVQISEDNSLPPGQRTQRVVKRLISAVRAFEGEVNDELRKSNEQCRMAQGQVIALQDRLRTVETELL